MARLRILGLCVVALLVVLVLSATTYRAPGAERSTATSSLSVPSDGGGEASLLGAEPPGSLSGAWLTASPDIVGGASTVQYPPGYDVLANFTLGVINADRASAGLPPVTLSSVPSGQQHADSMAYFRYFSHWDNQGYKPYMRYSLLGGTGSVWENLAVNRCSETSPDGAVATPAPCTIQTAENAINASEWGMMNNDTTCCGDGHRADILGPFHNHVSLGLAYNSTTVYLVEDFEDSYISSGSLQLSRGVVTFAGSLPQEPWAWMNRTAGAEITVFYDPPPTGINASQLRQSASCAAYGELEEPAQCRYLGAYGPGTLVSTVLTPCPMGACASENFTYAAKWDYSSGNFSIVFSIASLESAHGSGVYTFYLWPAERAPEPITSTSVFVGGA